MLEVNESLFCKTKETLKQLHLKDDYIPSNEDLKKITQENIEQYLPLLIYYQDTQEVRNFLRANVRLV